MTTKKGIIADLLLVLICVFWGMSFILVKLAIMEVNLFWFIFLRFALATTALSVVFVRRLGRFTWPTFRDGFILGSVNFLTFVLQVVGLKYTSASNSGFITGLHVILVPLILALFFKRMPAPSAVVGAILAATGLSLLTIGDDFSVNRGDVWTMACAVSVAFHVILTGWYAVKHDVYLLAITQLGAVTFWAGGASLVAGHAPASLSPFVIVALVFLALVATAFNFTVQTWAQQYTSPTRAAVIFTTEPIFSAIFAYWWGGEILKARGYVGAALIVGGIVFSELKAREWGEEEKRQTT
jgi:drug/metabolite transporter (DMT)-like permease